MTLPPHRIGDKGQDWILEAYGYPDDGWSPIAYANDYWSLWDAEAAILLAPRCRCTRIMKRSSALSKAQAGGSGPRHPLT